MSAFETRKFSETLLGFEKDQTDPTPIAHSYPFAPLEIQDGTDL
jgi:hypothetical protein